MGFQDLPSQWSGQGTWDILKSWLRPGKWISPVFSGTWSNYGSGYRKVSYRKNSDGLVTVRGLAQRAGAAGSVIFVLPEGFRPTEQEGWATYYNGGATRIDVSPLGEVLAFVPEVAMPAPGGFIWLTPIRFYTD